MTNFLGGGSTISLVGCIISSEGGLAFHRGGCGFCATVVFLPILVWFLGHSDILATIVIKHICHIDVTYLQRDI